MPWTFAGGANNAPSDLLALFWGEERAGGWEEWRRHREGREEEKWKGKGGILCSCDFSLGKTLH